MLNQIKTNNSSVISTTVGILSLVIPFIGFILGVIGVVFSRKAVKQINQTGESGRVLATVGLTCSIVGIIIQITLTIGFIISFI